ncbi:hypothetical protein JCM11641_003252 [Rhodosporidiobolus odoratus]
MSTPPLTAELITKIFRHLWLDLSTDLTTAHLVTPRNAPFILAPLLLVSRSFYRLALPFWFGHIESLPEHKRNRRVQVLDKHELKQVQDIMADNEERLQDPSPYVCPRPVPEVEDLLDDAMSRELQKCRSLFAQREDLEQLEVGRRSRRMTRSSGVCYRDFLPYNNDFEEANCDQPAGFTLIAMCREVFLELPHLRSLRVHAPAGCDLSGVLDLILRLEVIDVLSSTSQFDPIIALVLAPLAEHLEHLILEGKEKHPLGGLPFCPLFSQVSFPSLKTIRLPAFLLALDADARPFLNASSLEEAHFTIPPGGRLPLLPSTLKHLSILLVYLDDLNGLQRSLRASRTGPSPSFLNLHTVTIETLSAAPGFQERHHDLLRELAALAEEVGITLLGSWWSLLSDDLTENEAYQPEAEVEDDGKEGSSGDEDTSEGEDEPLDWDAEEDSQFRLLWSEDKRRANDFAQALEPLRPHLLSSSAFETVKTVMSEVAEPYLKHDA